MKKWIPSILFNLVELVVILGVGYVVNGITEKIVIVILAFVITRIIIGRAKHYKSPLLCFVWSTIIFASLFFILNIGIIISVLTALFSAFILSGYADIDDMFMWTKIDKFDYLFDFVNTNNKELKEYENFLYQNYELKYLIYVYRFKKQMSFAEIAADLNITTQKLNSELNIIGIRIEEIYKK